MEQLYDFVVHSGFSQLSNVLGENPDFFPLELVRFSREEFSSLLIEAVNFGDF